MYKERVLIIVAHPDDEVIGCGGTIAAHAQRGDEVSILFLADGVTSRFFNPNKSVSREEELSACYDDLLRRKQESREAAEILGVGQDHLYYSDLADQRLDSYPLLVLVKHVEGIVSSLKPDLIYTHFWNDLNIDHRLVFQAVATACRPGIGKPNIRVFSFEVPETTWLSIPDGKDAFQPSCILDVSDTLKHKLRAMGAYESEHRTFPHPRSIEFLKKLAEERAQGQDFSAGEAFVERRCLNEINKEKV